MPTRGLLLIETHDGLACQAIGTRGLRQPIDATDDDVVAIASVAADYATMHRLGSSVVVALDSSSVFFVPLDADDLDQRDRTSLSFALEDSLPLDAEQLVADFDLRPPQSAIAVDVDRFGPLIEALEQSGLRVQSIVPAASLLIAGLPSRTERLLWATGPDRVDVIDRDGPRLLGWRDAALDQLPAVLRIDPAETPLVSIGLDDADALGAAPLPVDDAAAIARQARRLLAGSLTPQYELRRDRLDGGDPYRRIASTLGWTALAACLFTGTVVGLLLWKAGEARETTADLKAEQRTYFAKALPDSDASRLSMTRLRREHAKLLGSRQVDPAVPQATASLAVLHGFLTGRTEAVRSRVIDLRIDGAELRVSIEVNDHDDAARLAEGLEAAGFTMDSPATIQRDDGTIISTLRGDWSEPQAAATSNEAIAAGSRRKGDS